MTRWIEFTAISLSALVVAVSSALVNFWTGALLALLLGLAWLYTSYRRNPGLSTPCFGGLAFLYILLSLYGVLPVVVFGGFIAALAGWDLTRFNARLAAMTSGSSKVQVTRLHLQRLGMALGIGTAVGLASILIHIQVRFALIFFLGLFTVVALAYALRRLIGARKKEG